MKKQIEDTPQSLPVSGEGEANETPSGDMPDEDLLRQLRSENAELITAIQLGAAKERVVAALTVAGARSPGLLFDAAKVDLQFLSDGTLANESALVERLKAKFPEQFGYDRPASIDGGAGRVPAPALSREALARMSPAAIAKLNWAEVRQVLASGK
jgi:hypothetical protein